MLRNYESTIKEHHAYEDKLRQRVMRLERQLTEARDWMIDVPALTAAEVERLAMLAEECGEVAQAVGKILRHGWESKSPRGGPVNRIALAREVGDLRAVVNLMIDAGDLELNELQHWQRCKRSIMAQWTHHQSFGDQRTESRDQARGGGDVPAA